MKCGSDISMWNLEDYKNNTAIADEYGRALTYGQLQEECRKLAEAVGTRCVVFILCENSIGSLLGYVGLLNNRIVPVMLNSHLERGLLHNLMEAYCPAYLWVPAEQKHAYGNADCVYEAYGYALLKMAYGRGYPLYEDLALLLTTSGSTAPNLCARAMGTYWIMQNPLSGIWNWMKGNSQSPRFP